MSQGWLITGSSRGVGEALAEAVLAAVRAAAEAFGRLDVMVNDAGYGNVAIIEEGGDADFPAQQETNFFGSVNVTTPRCARAPCSVSLAMPAPAINRRWIRCAITLPADCPTPLT